MKPDIPLIGRPSVTAQALDVLHDGLREMADQYVNATRDLEAIRRVQELRASMGIETPATGKINVRKPPRYIVPRGAID